MKQQIHFTLFFFLLNFLLLAQDTEKMNLGMNLDYPSDWSAEQPFVNIFKTCRPWQTQNIDFQNGDTWNTNNIQTIGQDENGYPLNLPLELSSGAQCAFAAMMVDHSGNYPSGEYVCLYDGTGVIDFDWDATIIEQTSGRIVLNVNPSISGNEQGILLRILVSDADDHVRNIRVMESQFEETYETEPFHPCFLEKLDPFYAIRFMLWNKTTDYWWNGIVDENELEWEDRWPFDHYTYHVEEGAIPYEYFPMLCNQLNTNPWLCVPHNASDDYIEQLALFLKERLNSDLHIYLEYSNEVWDSTNKQHNYILGNPRDPSANFPVNAAMYSENCWDIFKEVFSEEPERIKTVLGAQMKIDGSIWFEEQMLNYLGFGACNYLSPSWLFSYGGSQIDDLESLGESVTPLDVVEATRTATEVWHGPRWQAFYNLAEEYGAKLAHYEGGQSIRYLDAPEPLLNAIHEAQVLPEMHDLYRDVLHGLDEIGSDLAMAFVLTRKRKDTFGHLDFQCQSAEEAPKYQALIDFINEENTVNVNDIERDVLQVSIYPNPFKDQLVIESKDVKGVLNLQIRDLLGRLISFQNLDVGLNKQHQISLKELPKGIYILKLQSEKRIEYVEKIVKQ